MLKLPRPLLAVAGTLALLLPTTSRAQQQDVPYVPTPQVVVDAMLDLAAVRQTDVVYDLGSGDGRIPITAAERFGARGLGVEIVPELVRQSEENARVAGVQDRVQFRTQDLFQTDLSAATVITLYLLPQLNLRLRDSILQLRPGTRIVSHDFDMADWRPDRTVTVQGPTRQHTAYFWNVPARVAGTWNFTLETPEGARQYALNLTQQFQRVSGQLNVAGQSLALLSSELNGDRLGFTFQDTLGGQRSNFTVSGRISGNTFTASAVIAGGPLAGTKALTATRAASN